MRCALINVFYDLLFKCLKKEKNFIFINFAIVFECNLTIDFMSFNCIFTTYYLPIKFIYFDLWGYQIIHLLVHYKLRKNLQLQNVELSHTCIYPFIMQLLHVFLMMINVDQVLQSCGLVTLSTLSFVQTHCKSHCQSSQNGGLLGATLAAGKRDLVFHTSRFTMTESAEIATKITESFPPSCILLPHLEIF